jgi:hypothetical protein
MKPAMIPRRVVLTYPVSHPEFPVTWLAQSPFNSVRSFKEF